MYSFSGFRDGHCHPLFAQRESAGLGVSSANSVAQIVDQIASYLDQNPDIEWVDCGSFEPGLATAEELTAIALDAASEKVPVVVHAADHHSIWVNSAALRVAGLLDSVPIVTNGVVEVDSAGTATGILREWNAMSLIYAHQPAPSLESDLDALDRAQERLLTAGVVAVQEAWIDRGMPEVYVAAAKRGSLKIRVNLSPRIDPADWRADLDFAKATRSLVRAADNALLTANTVKIFVDGVFTSGTALTKASYCDGHHAEAIWETEQLYALALAADSAGFQLHFHAIGDDAVSRALDAIDHVLMCNGPVDRRPVIAHAELIDPSDYKRIREMGVVVCQQPVWATEGQAAQQVRDLLGADAATSLYPIRDLLDARIRVSFGSDWPVSEPEPLPGVYTATNRRVPESDLPSLSPEQSISRSQALAAYSTGVAYQLGQENELGDRVVFDTDLANCDDDSLLAAQVLEVWVNHQQVWQR